MTSIFKEKMTLFRGLQLATDKDAPLHMQHEKLVKNIFQAQKLRSKLISVNKSSCGFLLKRINNKYFESQGNIENLAFAYRIAKNLKPRRSTMDTRLPIITNT